MKNIKTLLLTVLFVSITHLVSGQIKINWENIKIIKDKTIVVKVFAQNYGQGFEFYNGYGYYGNKKEANFYVEYDLLREGRRIKLLPNSITIKTIFGSSIEMDTPTYFFNSTGTENGQNWEIIFDLPYESANIVITVLGSKKGIDDFEQDKELKNKLKAEFLDEKDSKVFNYEILNNKEYLKLEDKIKTIVYGFGENRKKGIISGEIIFNISKDGTTTYKSTLNNPELNGLIQNSIENFKLIEARQYGFNVSAEAKYEIFLAKGMSKTKLSDENKIIKSKPIISNKQLIKAIENDIDNAGNYKVKYDIKQVNGQWYPYSFVRSEKTSFNFGYIYWGVPAVIGLIMGVTGGGS
jgi:hypothetical protein